jgi:hypothetical protein
MDDPFNPERKIVRLKKQNLFGSGYAGFGVPTMRTVILKLAFSWTCEDCGTDHHARGVPIPIEEIADSPKREILRHDEGDPECFVAPDRVTCPDCGRAFRTTEA